MEEARRVLERLDRIEALRESSAPARRLLDEVRELLAEAEAWARVDPAGAGAEAAVARLRDALEGRPSRPSSEERTLVA